MELLVLLIFFHLILDINSQNLPQPQLSVSPEVITQRGSVQLHCHVPDHRKVYQCFFYPETQNTNLKFSPSCQLSVTGSELITWTGHRSPEALRIICYYAINESVRVPSLHSLPAPVTVMYQKPRLSVSYDDQTNDISLACEISESESVTADVSCNLYTGENPQPYLNQRSKKKTSRNLSCIFTAQRNDVFNVLQSVKSSEVSCDYSLISDSTARSLMSDKYNLIPFFPTLTQTSTTETSTAGLFPAPTQTSTTETSTGLFSAPTQTSTTETSTAGSFSTQTQTSTTETSTGLFPAQTQTSTTETSTGLFPTPTQMPTTETSTGLFSTQTQTSTTETSTAGLFSTPTQTSTTETFTTASPDSTTDLITTKHITTHLSSEVFPSTSSTTKEKTHSPLETSTRVFYGNPKSEPKPRSLFVLMLSANAVAVSLAALMSFGLCWFIKKQKAVRRKLDVTRGDQGLVLPMINLNSSGADADESYAVITSVPLPALPLDPSGHVKEDSKKPEDDVYHVYSSIIDTPGVSSDREVSLYSLLQSH